MSKKKNEDTFCIFPFTHLILATKRLNVNFLLEKFRKSCSVKGQGLRELWNNEKNNKLREGFLHGEKAVGCHRCWKLEEGGQRELSLRKGI